MQRLKQHNRITQIIRVRHILNVCVLRPIRFVFAYWVRFEESEVQEEDEDDEDFTRVSDALVAAHEGGVRRRKGARGY
jgi:hypothetical protein